MLWCGKELGSYWSGKRIWRLLPKLETGKKLYAWSLHINQT